MKNVNLYKLTNTILSFILGIIAVYYLYISLKEKADTIDLTNALSIISKNMTLLIGVVVLMMLNWGIELIKWNILLKRVEQLSIKQLVESLTLGILLSMITPNRIGEFGGRQLYIASKNRLISFYYQSFGALSQLLITVVMGLIGVMYYFHLAENSSSYTFGITIMIGVILGLYFFSNLWVKVLEFVKKKFEKLREQELGRIDTYDRLNTLLFSTGRYAVFCIQFILIFGLFSPTGEVRMAATGLSITFLIAAIVPTTWLSEIAVRSSIVFFVFEKLGLESSAAVISSVLLWIVNLLIPSLLGLFSLNKVSWSNLTLRKGK